MVLRAQGYSVAVFFDGESAEKEFLKNASAYELIILDLMLPRKNGFEVCQTLRKEGIPTPITVPHCTRIYRRQSKGSR